MAGGKETPRQKMIGMMYLVLTALLALNVSKSILDAFVAIEENIQKANITEVYRGNEKRSDLIELTTDQSNPYRAEKAKMYLSVVEKIDAMTAKRIKLIDDIKLEILEACGENVKTTGIHEIIVKKYDGVNAPCKPIRMNLDAVQGKDKYDDPMRVLLGDATDIKKPAGKGMEIWKSLLSYRKDLTELIASSQVVVEKDSTMHFDATYKYKAPQINAFNSPAELDRKIEKSIESANVHADDKSIILEIYRSLSKEEYSTVHEIEGVHWLGKTFDHAPSVAAIASLSSLQKEILSARAQAIAHIRGRVAGGDYSFNTVLPLAIGPEVVNQGEEFMLSVLMAAFDTDKQPRVTMNGEPVTDVREGKGIMKLKGTSGVMEFKGTVAIQNKQGVWKEQEWTKTVTVMKPSGSIELSEMNVLYRGYDNKINATASGYPTTILTAQGASVSKSGEGYIVRPNSGAVATLSVAGRTADGKTVQLKRMEFKVKRLPKPTLFWGSEEDGGRVNGSRTLIPKYTDDIVLNASFRVDSWECTASGMRTPPISGTGGNFSSANSIIQNATPGSIITLMTWVVGPDGVRQRITGSWQR